MGEYGRASVISASRRVSTRCFSSVVVPPVCKNQCKSAVQQHVRGSMSTVHPPLFACACIALPRLPSRACIAHAEHACSGGCATLTSVPVQLCGAAACARQQTLCLSRARAALCRVRAMLACLRARSLSLSLGARAPAAAARLPLPVIASCCPTTLLRGMKCLDGHVSHAIHTNRKNNDYTSFFTRS